MVFDDPPTALEPESLEAMEGEPATLLPVLDPSEFTALLEAGLPVLGEMALVPLDATLPETVVALLDGALVVAAVVADLVKPRLNVSVGCEDVEDEESGAGASGMILMLW